MSSFCVFASPTPVLFLDDALLRQGKKFTDVKYVLKTLGKTTGHLHDSSGGQHNGEKEEAALRAICIRGVTTMIN